MSTRNSGERIAIAFMHKETGALGNEYKCRSAHHLTLMNAWVFRDIAINHFQYIVLLIN